MAGEITIDGNDEGPIFSTVCTYCRHLSLNEAKVCAAFPNGIPEEIWKGDNNHRLPAAGDNGIQFEPLEGPQG